MVSAMVWLFGITPEKNRPSRWDFILYRWLKRIVIAHPLRVIFTWVCLLGVFGFFGLHASRYLRSGGYVPANAPSQVASNLLAKEFGQPSNLGFVIRAKNGAITSKSSMRSASEILSKLRSNSSISAIESFIGPGGSGLVSSNKSEGLILVTVKGKTSMGYSATTASIVKEILPRGPNASYSDVSVIVGGFSQIGNEITNQTTSDLKKAETIAIPITFLLLLVAFGSVVAALLPAMLGLASIPMTLAVLYFLARTTHVSIFALNMTTALGLGLSIDYSLLVVSRFREELALGYDALEAIERTIETAGRTIFFSALTVAVSLAVLITFPVYFIRSFGFAGIAVVFLSALAALLLLPSVLVLLGERVNSLALFAKAINLEGESHAWRRLSTVVTSRPFRSGVPVVGVLLIAALPLMNIHFGTPDQNSLPINASARQFSKILATDFPFNENNFINVVTSTALSSSSDESYAKQLSEIAGVSQVLCQVGIYQNGTLIPGSNRANASSHGPMVNSNASLLDVSFAPNDLSPQAQSIVHKVQATLVPGGGRSYISGFTATLIDQNSSIARSLPLAIALISLGTFILLFLFTRSFVLPLKALVLDGLSIAASFGFVVWVFQEGHALRFLGFTPQPLPTQLLVLMFCLSFGLSIDYEVFLLSRIKEGHDQGLDTISAVINGMSHTGGIITTAALILSVTFFSFGSSSLSFLQVFGVGTGVAVVLDATLVRGILVPAIIRVMGDANWWNPTAKFTDRSC